MQVLKEEIRLSILETAQRMFLHLGFEKTSMKEIAQEIGVSVGNLYRYFPNKEALFDAVTMPAYNELTQLITDNEHAPSPSIADLPTIIEQLSQFLSQFLTEHRESLLILLYRSKGTRHEQVKEALFEQLAEHTRLHITEYNRTHVGGTLLLEVSRPIAVAFLEGYFEIIRLHDHPEQIHQITTEYASIWFMGLQKLL